MIMEGKHSAANLLSRAVDERFATGSAALTAGD